MSFDKNLAKKIQDESVKALEKIAKKYGVTIKSNGGTLGSNDFGMKLKVELEGVSKNFDSWIFESLGLPKDIIGKKFMSNGKEFTITDLAPNRPKFPVIAMSTTDGRSYKFTIDSIKRTLKIK